MSQSQRMDVTAAACAIAVASFGAFLLLFFAYFVLRPAQPQPMLGMVYLLSNHGGRVYVTAAELTGLSLLMKVFLAALALTIVSAPKVFTRVRQTTPRWLRDAGVSVKIDMGARPSSRFWRVFVLSAGLYVAVISFAGRWIVDALISRGIILAI